MDPKGSQTPAPIVHTAPAFCRPFAQPVSFRMDRKEEDPSHRHSIRLRHVLFHTSRCLDWNLDLHLFDPSSIRDSLQAFWVSWQYLQHAFACTEYLITFPYDRRRGHDERPSRAVPIGGEPAEGVIAQPTDYDASDVGAHQGAFSRSQDRLAPDPEHEGMSLNPRLVTSLGSSAFQVNRQSIRRQPSRRRGMLGCTGWIWLKRIDWLVPSLRCQFCCSSRSCFHRKL